MISFKNGGNLVESIAELPNLRNAKRLYLDFETTAFDASQKALNSWKGHRFCGVCITADDVPGAWYVSSRCTHSRWNLPLDSVLSWLRDMVESCKDWVNHNVKFDAHFAAADGIHFKGRLVDTLTLSKLIDSDRMLKGGYGLKVLSRDWLEEDISRYDNNVSEFLKGCKLINGKHAHDYGLIPADILGEYGCQDVLSNRRLYEHILRRRPDEIQGVWNTEIELTPVLFDIECEGMRVDDTELKIQEFKIMSELIEIEEELHTRVGFPVEPHKNNSCYELLINHFGLPVLAYNESGNPSFDKSALADYLAHPRVAEDVELREIVNTCLHYRKRHTLLTFFVRPYQEHAVDGVMHPDYDQSKRTGRMGCRRPNAQQLSHDAKLLIHPGEGEAFLSCDYSQIEFRLIVHYIRDIGAIKAYAEDPDTDFHQWVANLCGIARGPAKNVNFAMGFGAGRRRVTEMLAADLGLMKELQSEGSQKDELSFRERCVRRAESVYRTYHETLSGLRGTTRTAARRIAARGYVFNAYGRRRHLPEKAAHIAFNSIIQSCAADVMKERTVALAPRYNSWIRDLGIKIVASVHDETLLIGDSEVTKNPDVVSKIVKTLENTDVKFRVPIRTSAGWSDKTWADASDSDLEIVR